MTHAMLLSLKNEHRKHLELLFNQNTQVMVDFCKLAIDFIQNGPNLKLYTTASEKLNITTNDIQNCIYGLVNLLLESCKHKLNDADFRDSVLTAGFTQEQQVVLSKFYNSKYKEIGKALEKLAVDEPHYHDLNWRFEVMIGSRALLHQVTPLIAMDLVLQTKTATLEEKQEHILLQTDPGNLLHLTEELENALTESKSRHFRRIQRTFTNC